MGKAADNDTDRLTSAKTGPHTHSFTATTKQFGSCLWVQKVYPVRDLYKTRKFVS